MTVELAAHIAGQFNLNCATLTHLWKLTLKEENCRMTISYLQEYSYPKLQLQKSE